MKRKDRSLLRRGLTMMRMVVTAAGSKILHTFAFYTIK